MKARNTSLSKIFKWVRVDPLNGLFLCGRGKFFNKVAYTSSSVSNIASFFKVVVLLLSYLEQYVIKSMFALVMLELAG